MFLFNIVMWIYHCFLSQRCPERLAQWLNIIDVTVLLARKFEGCPSILFSMFYGDRENPSK
jgi:hypothetical protein